MKAVDTNVIVRYLVRDDVEQAKLATDALRDRCFVTSTVLIETVWVLSSRYRVDRKRIAQAIRQLLTLSTVVVEDREGLNWAIDRFDREADFADMLHLVSSRAVTAFLTFDRKLARQAGAEVPVPIETLG